MNTKKYLAAAMLGLTTISLALTSCTKEETQNSVGTTELPSVVENKSVDFYLLIGGKKLVKMNLQTLDMPGKAIELDGMESGEIISGIDFRPATGQLYGIGSTSRLYVINPETGKMRAIGTAPFSPALSGTMTGFDFNPTVDRIRVVTNMGQNLRLNPETGTVAAIDGSINGAAGASITAAAYTNNKAGATTTVLYDIDVANKKLYKQDPPNNGVLVEVGSLMENISGEGGFDIAPDGSVALAAFGSSLYSINLETGKATKITGGAALNDVTGLAISTEPTAYAVDETNNLWIFNPMSPEPVAKAITGLSAGERIEGIDFRPANGQLYGLSTAGKIYTINSSNGAALAVGTNSISPALSGASFGFDFNPTVDRIRVVSDLGQNLRLHPETGAVAAVDLNLSPAGVSVAHAAYTNNFAGATTTVLFDIETMSDKLFRQDPPNNGILVEVGSLGIDVTNKGGFDIGGRSGKAYAILTTVAGDTRIYTIDLGSGKATAVAPFPKMVTGFAVGLGF